MRKKKEKGLEEQRTLQAAVSLKILHSCLTTSFSHISKRKFREKKENNTEFESVTHLLPGALSHIS